MTLREAIIKNSGLTYMVEQEQLEEGIRFFKDSKKAEAFLSKMRDLSKDIKHAKVKSLVMSGYSNINSIRRKLKNLEEKFSNEKNKVDKEALKAEHKKLAQESSSEMSSLQASVKELAMELGKEYKEGKLEAHLYNGFIFVLIALVAGYSAYGGYDYFNSFSQTVSSAAAGTAVAAAVGSLGASVLQALNVAARSIRHEQFASFGKNALKSSNPGVQRTIEFLLHINDTFKKSKGKDYRVNAKDEKELLKSPSRTSDSHRFKSLFRADYRKKYGPEDIERDTRR